MLSPLLVAQNPVVAWGTLVYPTANFTQYPINYFIIYNNFTKHDIILQCSSKIKYFFNVFRKKKTNLYKNYINPLTNADVLLHSDAYKIE